MIDSIGEKIKKLRIKKNMTQQELANILNVTDKTISSYECNRTIPDINMLFKLSSVLDTNIYSLLSCNLTNINNLEIEVKFKVEKDEYNRLLNDLKNNSKQICNVYQIDKYYVPKYKKFSNEWLRIRNEEEKHILTYKKKINENCCEELELLFDNCDNFEKILFNLEFELSGTVSKNRRKILYKDKYEFSFDNVENIGLFIEIEVKKIENDKMEEIKKLMNLLEEFSIDTTSIIEKRYYDYLLEELKWKSPN